jgi:hypothetical protein
MKNLLLALTVVLLSPVLAKAQFITGSMGVIVDPFTTSTSSFTSSSVSLNQLNLITHSETGTFLTFVPALSDLTASTALLSGLSATPTVESVPNFLVFSTPDTTLSTSGTTPSNRFSFDLTSLSETAYNGSTATFSGSGVITDSLGAFSATQATLDLAFSSQSGYTLTISIPDTAAVPEPSTWALMLGGFGMLLFLTRRQAKFRR